MRFGVHTALWVRSWGEDLAPHVARAASLGFDGAEVSLLGLEPAAAAPLRCVADGEGVALTCTTGLSAATDVSSADPAVRTAGIEHLRRAADIVAELGAEQLCGVLYGPWGTGATVGRAERQRRAAASLAEVAPAFAERGIVLGLEAVNRFETDLVTTAAESLAMVEATGAPNVGVHLDTFHMNVEERSLAEAITTAGDRLVHLHVVDNDRGVPGRGHIPWGDVVAGVAATGYDGWATLEMFVRRGVPVSDDLRIWRTIEADPTEAAIAGLSFLRARFGVAA